MFTAEQQAIIRWAASRLEGDVAVANAGAGTGKTTTICAVADYLGKQERMLYLVFNRKNRLEAAEKLRGKAEVHTLNSFAYREMRVAKLGRKLYNSITPRLAVETLQLSQHQDGYSHWQIARIVLDTLNNYCLSADKRVKHHHVANHWCLKRRAEFPEFIAHLTQSLYDQLKPGALTNAPLSHALYAKEWANLGAPGIKAYSLVCVDEAQDLGMDQIQAIKHARSLLLVGDDSQAIYGFRKAVNAMRQFPGAEQFALSQSFRFGEAIATLANGIIAQKYKVAGNNLFKPLVGLDGVASKVGPLPKGTPHARIYRSNYLLIAEALFFIDHNLPIALVGDMRDAAARLESAYALRNGQARRGQLHYSMAPFRHWDDLEEAADKDRELTMYVKLVKENPHRCQDIVKMMNTTHWDPNPAVRLMTGHASKGMEFDYCVVAEDFEKNFQAAVKSKDTDLINEELNLQYVAATRAKLNLDVQNVHMRELAISLRLLAA